MLITTLFACGPFSIELDPLSTDSGSTDSGTTDSGSTDSGSTDSGTFLSDILDFSVNSASAIAGDGLPLRTEAGSNEPGGFNGAGVGNKAIAGLPGYDGRSLASLSGLAWESLSIEGPGALYFNMLLELDCAGSTPIIVVADTSMAETSSAGDHTRTAFTASAAQWRAVGGLDDILPSHLDMSAAGSLTDVVDAYPFACLRDVATGDAGMPTAAVTSAVLLILGDSTNTTANEQHVAAVEVGEVRWE